MIRLKYLDTMGLENADILPPQPALVYGKGNKRPTRVVPIHKDYNAPEPCAGCVAMGDMIERAYAYDSSSGSSSLTAYDCYSLPDCDNAIFVRATPENKIKHIAWRLENDR